MTIEIVDFPIENAGSFHSFWYVYQAGSPVSESPGEEKNLLAALDQSPFFYFAGLDRPAEPSTC